MLLLHLFCSASVDFMMGHGYGALYVAALVVK